jgi:hypothetical protein
VAQRVPHSISFYDHPVWNLAGHEFFPTRELGTSLREVETFRWWVLDPASSPDSPFWLARDFDHRCVISKALERPTADPLWIWHYLGKSAILIALVHDALNRQREVQHFEAHVALAQHAKLQPSARYCDFRFDLEAILIARWLGTSYRKAQLRDRMEALRRTDLGWPPFTGRQLPMFGLVAPRKEQEYLTARLGHRIAERLASMPVTLDIQDDA